MSDKSSRKQWLSRMAKFWPLAKGSLNEVRKSCSRPGCKGCASGVRHPAFLFTYRKDGKLHALHVPRGMVPLVRDAIRNARAVEQCLVDAGADLIKNRKRTRR